MDALALCKAYRDNHACVPCDDQGRGDASNGQLRRWLDNGSGRVNGVFPKATDEIAEPITDWVYFPGKRRQTSLF